MKTRALLLCALGFLCAAPARAAVSCSDTAASAATAANASSYASNSWTPVDGRLYYAMGFPRIGSPTASATVTNPSGMTWTEISPTGESQELEMGSTDGRLPIYRAIASSPSTGTTTFDYGAASVLGHTMIIVECTGFDDSGGSNGSAATVQAVCEQTTGTPTTQTLTLAAFGNSNNATLGFSGTGVNEAQDDQSGDGFTELSDIGHNSPTSRGQAIFKNSADTTIINSSASGSPRITCGIEIKASAPPANARRPVIVIGGWRPTLSTRMALRAGVVPWKMVRELRETEDVRAYFAALVPQGGSTKAVREASTGDASGSDWNNACGGFAGSCAAASLTRGDTYCVADGAYGVYTFSTAVSGSLVITIRKAWDADGVCDQLAGWSATLGDGQAVFSTTSTTFLRFHTDYWTFDGGRRGADWRSGYGFKVDNTACASIGAGKFAMSIGNPQGSGDAQAADNVTIQYVDVLGAAQFFANACHDFGITIRQASDNAVVSYSWVHDAGFPIHMGGAATGTLRLSPVVERNFLGPNWGNSSNHSGCLNVTFAQAAEIRFNIFYNCISTAPIDSASGSADTVSNDWRIHGNVFVNSTSAPSYCTAGWGGTSTLNDGGDCTYGDGFFAVLSNITLTGVVAYHNTFINYRDGSDGPGRFKQSNSGTVSGTYEIKNNICYLCKAASTAFPSGADATHISAWDSTAADGVSSFCTATGIDSDCQNLSGNPLADFASFNFHPTATALAAMNAGATLGAGYQSDPDGVNRSTATPAWIRGAYASTGVKIIPRGRIP